MTRARQADQYTISLFPMFNILICTLGVLIFILGSLATLTLGAGKSVSIAVDSGVDSTSRNHEKIPHYFEWDGTRLVSHPGRETVVFGQDVDKIRTFEDTYSYMDNVIDGSALDELIQNITESNGNDYVVLLVRPSGFGSLYEIRGYFETKGIALGYEPVMQEWNLRIRE